MKTAICIFGLFKELPRCIRSWKFLNHLNYDIYFSTYNYTYERNTNLGINIFEEVTEQEIKDLFPSAQNILINLENKDNNELNSLHNSDKMLYHWKKCWSMLCDSGVIYDSVFLVRPDIIFENSTEISLSNLDCSSEDIIYGGGVRQCPPPTYISTMDILTIGNPIAIGKIITGMNFIYDYTKFFEYHLAKFLVNNDIYSVDLGNMDVIYAVVRSNSRELINSNINGNFDGIFLNNIHLLTHRFSETVDEHIDRALPFRA